MKYLINKETKKHVIYVPWLMNSKWTLVEADSEGWIAHTGNECPLPDDVRCDLKFSDGEARFDIRPVPYNWRGDSRFIITHYRPILAEKVQAPEPIPAQLTTNTLDLLGTLKRAHKAAQQIPDLEAELREVLAGMGYDLVARSPFVEPEEISKRMKEYHKDFMSLCSQVRDPQAEAIAEPEAAAEPEPDMTDWRNWRVGDLVECVNGDGHVSLASGNLVTVRQVQFTNGTIIFCHPDGFEGVALTRRFRFHSRPAKGGAER